MLQYIIKRILIAIPTTIGALTFIFFTMRILPGDPAVALMGEAATPEALADMRQMLGLDKPWMVQYGTYLWGAMPGDFGRSIATNYPVTSYIRRMFPYTFLLALSGIGVAILIGMPIGILSSLRRNTPLDFVLRLASLIGLSIPVFYLGILLLIAFSLYLEWFPLIGGGDFSDPFSILHHLVLPATALGLTLAAFVTRLTRSAMLEVISQDYIRTARAKGVHEGRVIFKHALCNTLIPLAAAGYSQGLQVHTWISNRQDYNETMVMIQEQFKRVGIELKIEVAEHAKLHEYNLKNLQSHMALVGGVELPHAQLWLDERFQSKSLPPASNFSNYKTPQVDPWLHEAEGERDPQTQQVLYAKISRQIMTSAANGE